MSRRAEYTIVSIDLTAAGREIVHGPWGVFRFLEAVDSAGDQAPDTKVTIRAERRGDQAPMRLGQAFFAAGTRRWVIEWAAQTGITATFGFADRPSTIDWDADPSARLVTGALKLKGGSTLTTLADDAITENTTELVLAANSTRRYAIIKNLAANLGTMRVGDSDTAAARGHEIAPGDAVVLETTAAIYVHAITAGQSVSVLEVSD